MPCARSTTHTARRHGRRRGRRLPVVEQGDPANILQPTGTGSDIGSGKGLSVTAADFDGGRAPFAGRGSQISIAAYGAFAGSRGGPRGIFGAFPASADTARAGAAGSPCFCRTTFDGDKPLRAMCRARRWRRRRSRRSPRCAHDLNPDLSAGDVIRILKRTARRPAGSGWNPELGWGILDGGAALNAARSLDRTRPCRGLSPPQRVGDRTIALHWSGSDPAPPASSHPASPAYESGARSATAVRSGSRRRRTTQTRAFPASAGRQLSLLYDRDRPRRQRRAPPGPFAASLRARRRTAFDPQSVPTLAPWRSRSSCSRRRGATAPASTGRCRRSSARSSCTAPRSTCARRSCTTSTSSSSCASAARSSSTSRRRGSRRCA